MKTITLTNKEIKLIMKCLINHRMGKDEQKTYESIWDKINLLNSNKDGKEK